MSPTTKDTVPVPPLTAGQRLTREEFERRYDAMPDLKKAELIEGVVCMPSPVRLTQHGEPHGDLMCWLGVYKASTPGVGAGDNATIRLDERNEPQPDGVLFIRNPGGRPRVGADDYIEGAPEFAAQVAAGTLALDVGPRMEAYRRNGIKEYLVWRVEDAVIDWFVLREGCYQPLSLTEGLYRSEVFPGLWLDPAALVRGDLAGVLQVLQRGLATTEHAAFVAQLQRRSAAHV
jgi:hypothetical protein